MSASPAIDNPTIDALDADQEIRRLRSMVEAMLVEAKRLGASAAEVGVSRDIGLQLAVREGDVETLEFNRDGGFGISVYFGQRKGHASCTDTRMDALRAAVKAACEIARHTAEDPYAGLPEAEMLATEFPDLDLDHAINITADQAIDIALRCEQAGLHAESSVKKTDAVHFSSHRGVRVYGNSIGFCQGVASSRHSISATMIAEDERGMQRDWWYTVARDPSELNSPESVGKTAAERAAKRLGARPMKTGSMPVLMVPEVARGFIGHLLSAARGGNLYRKSSFLCDKLGTEVMPNWLSLRERPFWKKGLASAAFDNEGVRTREHDIVADGKLESYVLSTYSARRLKLQSTGNAGGVHNLQVDSAQETLSFAQLLSEMGEGVVITSVMGQGINLVNGDYSRGASGFYVKNGEIQHAVEEITIAGSLPKLFKHIRVLGNDIERQSSIRTGSLLIDGFTVAGQHHQD
ncbi:microcin-processing peptidase 1 [Permianibacter aggregans]|uniref:Microcin-processing peptidase 1 n=2 Tax=Permianibacter aggregans TaxID=1510150 RepID=A0A4R6UMZ0_9GAMM|nr:microcin-processing peptidase 1 [Permianibacter aggregans]